MICDVCNTERVDKDFLKDSKTCYKCVYEEKRKNPKANPKIKQVLCRNCGVEVVKQTDLKIRQRTVYCSQKCAAEGHKHATKNHWCRRIPNII